MGINKGTEGMVDEVEGTVKAALTFLGNASSQWVYWKSTTKTGSSSARNHKTCLPQHLACCSDHPLLRRHLNISNRFRPSAKPEESIKAVRVFRRPPALCSAGGKSYTLQRHQPYSTKGVQRKVGPQQNK